MTRKHQQYRRKKVSGPVKGFIEAVRGFLAFVTVAVVAIGVVTGEFANVAPAAIVAGCLAGFFHWIASLIPSKNQFTEK